MQTTERGQRCRRAPGAKVIECIEGCYESLQVPFGVVYKWHPGSVLLECSCYETLVLTCSLTTCSKCEADHAVIVQEALNGECSEDEARQPWRFADREGVGLPCEEVYIKELRELSV